MIPPIVFHEKLKLFQNTAEGRQEAKHIVDQLVQIVFIYSWDRTLPNLEAAINLIAYGSEPMLQWETCLSTRHTDGTSQAKELMFHLIYTNYG
jgi:hypothetical protein